MPALQWPIRLSVNPLLIFVVQGKSLDTPMLCIDIDYF